MKLKISILFVIGLVVPFISNAQNNYELPFLDDFEQSDNHDGPFEKWTTENLSGWHYWHILAWGGTGSSQCMRFENTDLDQDDWLITKQIIGDNLEYVLINFDVLHVGEGVKPKLLYTDEYTGIASQSTWTEISYNLGANENQWSNSGNIILENPGDILYIACHYEAQGNQGIYILIDDFKVQKYTPPPTLDLIGESEHFEFYSEASNSAYWDSISPKVDHWYRELCSYWDRPGLDSIFDEASKFKVNLVEKNVINNLAGGTYPTWKYGYSDASNTFYLALPPGGTEDIYRGSFESVAKNTMGQFILKKRHIRDGNSNIPYYYSEGFGLYYSGYRPNRDSVILALNTLGREPVLSDIGSTLGITGRKKDLIVSYIEAQALSSVGIQRIEYGANELHWQRHFRYFYENVEAERITLRKQTSNFDIYSTAQDIQYLDAVANTLEERLEQYSSDFNFPIHHRINCVIYPDSEAGIHCLVVMSRYNGGSGWSGDKLDILSPKHFGIEGTLEFLIPHEFFHVFHFNMVKHLFTVPSFYSEGLANYMALGSTDLRFKDDLYKVEYTFQHYKRNYNMEPSLDDLLNSTMDEVYDYYNDPYFFGEIFYNYLHPDMEGYNEIKLFFTSNLDWNSYSHSYQEIDEGYIRYLKRLAFFVPQDSLYSIPFIESFDNFFNGWTKPNFSNQDNWQIGDVGVNQSNCALFYTHSENNEAIESWLITPALNAADLGKVVFSFDYGTYGENIDLEVFSTGNFNGDIETSDWNSLRKLSQADNWSNSNDIVINSPPDTLFIGIRYKASGQLHQQAFIDNFKVNARLTSNEITELANNQFNIYPNPVNEESIVSFYHETSGKVNLCLFDIHGRKISTILDKELPQGKHSIPIRKYIQGNGIFFCRLSSGSSTSTIKIVISK
jgi:hypothetical protein